MPENTETYCEIRRQADLSGLEQVYIEGGSGVQDYLQAMKLAERTAEEKLGEFMLLSWYDRDRDFESPQHSSECHEDSAVPGYVDYGIHHGARLMVDIEQGRFVFFFLPLNLDTE